MTIPVMPLTRKSNYCLLKNTIKSVSPLISSAFGTNERKSTTIIRCSQNHNYNQHQQYSYHKSFSTTSASSTIATNNNNRSIHHDAHSIINDRIIIKDLGEGIYNIQLNRPQKCNALDLQMFESIAETISILQNDYKSMNIRCIILSGNGKAFCTGLDVPSIIKPGNSDEPSGNGMMMPHTKMNRLFERPSGYDNKHNHDTIGKNDEGIGIGNLAQDVAFLWRSIPVPVIAVLHGMCYGGGMQIALGADIRIATPSCKLSIMEAKWGLIPDMSASITLRELVPIDIAKELTFTGRIIDGIEAKQLGLVTRYIHNGQTGESGELDDEIQYHAAIEEATTLAKDMVKNSPDAIAAAKLLYQKTWIDSNEEQCLNLESRLQKKLLPSWNQFVASAKEFGLKLAYTKQKDME